MTTSPFQPLNEDWQSALIVVAHPDDIEYGAASAVSKWTSEGKKVVYLLVTRGEAGIDGMHPDETREVRTREEIEGAEVVGVDTVEFLDYADGIVEYGLPLRRDIAKAIRRHRPEVIVTGNMAMSFSQGFANQADHRAVGLAALDASRDAGNRWIFPELVDEGLEPWNGVRFVATFGPSNATHGIDVSGYWERGLDSLRQHKAYLKYLGPDAADSTFGFLTAHAVDSGRALGCEHAVFAELVLINEPWG